MVFPMSLFPTRGDACGHQAAHRAPPTENSMIVVSGEALMDVFAAGETPTGVMLDARIGGSPLRRSTTPASSRVTTFFPATWMSS